MDRKKLSRHIKLCRRNLASQRAKCCAECPFEEDIAGVYPELKEEFEARRKFFTAQKSRKRKEEEAVYGRRQGSYSGGRQ